MDWFDALIYGFLGGMAFMMIIVLIWLYQERE